MQETNTSNNFLQNGIKHLFAEVGKKTHLDEESLALLAHPKFASRLPCPFQEGELEKAIGGIHHDGN